MKELNRDSWFLLTPIYCHRLSLLWWRLYLITYFDHRRTFLSAAHLHHSCQRLQTYLKIESSHHHRPLNLELHSDRHKAWPISHCNKQQAYSLFFKKKFLVVKITKFLNLYLSLNSIVIKSLYTCSQVVVVAFN